MPRRSSTTMSSCTSPLKGREIRPLAQCFATVVPAQLDVPAPKASHCEVFGRVKHCPMCSVRSAAEHCMLCRVRNARPPVQWGLGGGATYHIHDNAFPRSTPIILRNPRNRNVMHPCGISASNNVGSAVLTTVLQLQAAGSQRQVSCEHEAHNSKATVSKMPTNPRQL